MNMNDKAVRAAEAFIRYKRDRVKISKALAMSDRTLSRLIKTDTFHAALDERNYTGERTFVSNPRGPYRKTKNPKREEVLKLYSKLTSSVPERKRVGVIAEQTGVPFNTVRAWIAQARKKQ